MSSETVELNQENDEKDETRDIRRYVYLLRYWMWLIILVGITVSIVAFFILRALTPVYETSTKLLVIEAAANKPTDYTSVLASERLASTYADLATNEAVLQEVIDRLSIPITTKNLGQKIKATTVRNTQLIMVTVEGTNPELISTIANTVVEVLIEKVGSIQSDLYTNSMQSLAEQLAKIEKDLQKIQAEIDQTDDLALKETLSTQALQYKQIYSDVLMSYEQARLAEAQSSLNIVQINKALPPTEPTQPKVLLFTLVVGVLASLLVIGIIIILDNFDDTVKTPREVTRVLGVPVLGVVFHHSSKELPITQEKPRSQVSEMFRLLRANIQGANLEPLRTLLVTSPSQEEGSTLVSTNLSVVMAQGGKKVILIDANLRWPGIHKRMNLLNKTGLSSLLLNKEIAIGNVMQKTKTEGLFAITSGDLPPNPAELLWSKKMVLTLEKLKESADMVVMDTPPVLLVADTVILGPYADGVLLVLQPGKTSISATRQAIEQLQQVNTKVVGVILVNVDLKSSRYHYFYRKNYGYLKNEGN